MVEINISYMNTHSTDAYVQKVAFTRRSKFLSTKRGMPTSGAPEPTCEA